MTQENKWRVSKRRLSVVNDSEKVILRVYAPHHNCHANMNDLQNVVDRVCDRLNDGDKVLLARVGILEARLATATARADGMKVVIKRLLLYLTLHEQEHPAWNGNRHDDLVLAQHALAEAQGGGDK